MNGKSIVVYQSEFQRQSDLFWMQFFENHPWVPICFSGILFLIIFLIFARVLLEITGIWSRIRSKW